MSRLLGAAWFATVLVACAIVAVAFVGTAVVTGIVASRWLSLPDWLALVFALGASLWLFAFVIHVAADA